MRSLKSPKETTTDLLIYKRLIAKATINLFFIQKKRVCKSAAKKHPAAELRGILLVKIVKPEFLLTFLN